MCGTAASGGTSTVTNVLNLTLTNAGGTNQVVIVGCAVDSRTVHIASITYNGDALTEYGDSNHASIDASAELWYRVAPDSGTDLAVVITLDSTEGVACGAMICDEVQQAGANGPFRGVAALNSTDSGVDATVDVTSAAGDLVIDSANFSAPTAGTAGSGQTEKWDVASTTGGATCQSVGSTESGASGDVTMNWSHVNTSTASVGGSLVPAATGKASPIFFP